jgi:hypothetical protein
MSIGMLTHAKTRRARRGREVLTTKITKSTERDEEEEVAAIESGGNKQRREFN